MKKIISLLIIWISTISIYSQESYEYPFQNPALTFDDRVDDLVSRLTIEEKASLMLYNSPAIERLGIPDYNWWSECLHGVGRAGKATVFPQAIGMAATFDEELIYEVATAISDEARAKHHEAVRKGNRGQYMGLSFWTPNINIFRDPRWGRGQETYGEDPFLTSMIGTAFVKGLQGDHPKYLKTSACAKHYVVHSGPEKGRHHFNAILSAVEGLENVTINSVKNAILFTNKSHFLAVKPKKAWLDIEFVLDEKIEEFLIHKMVQASKYKWAHFIRIGKEEEVDDQLKEWIKQAYKVSK